MHLSASLPSTSKILLLGTGGTIAGLASKSESSFSAYTAGVLPVEDLLKQTPNPASIPVESQNIAHIDSKDSSPSFWIQLILAVQAGLDRPDISAIVITHGTDTLEESIFLIHQWFATSAKHKPILFTCAMRPANAPNADGPNNLAFALSQAQAWAQNPKIKTTPCIQLAMNQQLLPALGLVKTHPTHTHTFINTFEASSPTHLEAFFKRQTTPQNTPPSHWQNPNRWPSVEWITSHAGQTGQLVEAWLKHLISQSKQGQALHGQGLLVAGTGNASVHESLERSLSAAQKAGLTVWISSRCTHGCPRPLPEASSPFPIVPLPPAQARMALVLHLLQRNATMFF